jgi:hypothetical protein
MFRRERALKPAKENAPAREWVIHPPVYDQLEPYLSGSSTFMVRMFAIINLPLPIDDQVRPDFISQLIESKSIKDITEQNTGSKYQDICWEQDKLACVVNSWEQSFDQVSKLLTILNI